MAKGYAFVSKDGEINISTVSPNEQSAMVNSIVILSSHQVIPLNEWDDRMIQYIYEGIASDLGRIYEVDISVTPYN